MEIYSAPGRSEVGGNHTDHQYGKVLATSINLDAIAVTARTEDEKITIVSDGYERMEIGLNDLPAKEDESRNLSGTNQGGCRQAETERS